MAILFKCPECRAGLKIANDALAGKTITCPKCRTVVGVPAAKKAAPPNEDVEEAPLVDEEELPRSKNRRDVEAEDSGDVRPRSKKKKTKPVSFLKQYGLYVGLGGGGILVVGGVLTIVLSGGVGNANKRPGDIFSNVQTSLLTADQWLGEFQKDQKAANDRYRGQRVELTGEVLGFEQRLDGTATVRLRVENDALGVKCNTFDPEPWASLAPGQKIKIKSEVRGMHSDGPILQGCNVVEAGPSPALRMTVEQLTAELEKGHDGAVAKYKKKYIIISGEVLTGEPDQVGGFTSLLLKGRQESSLQCLCFDRTRDVVTRAARGKTATLLGQFDLDNSGKVVLTRCLLITK